MRYTKALRETAVTKSREKQLRLKSNNFNALSLSLMRYSFIYFYWLHFCHFVFGEKNEYLLIILINEKRKKNISCFKIAQ